MIFGECGFLTSEQMLLEMLKKSQYDVTRSKIQRLVMLMSSAAIAFGAVLTGYVAHQTVSMYLYIGTFVVILVAFLLQQFKVVSLNTATIINFSFLCFVFTPVNWYTGSGLFGATPYLSVIVMLVMILALSGKAQNIMKYMYLATILLCVVQHVVIVPRDTLQMEIYLLAAFGGAISLTVYFMSFMYKRYDEMHDQFLLGSIKDELTRVLSRRVLDVIIHHVEKEYRAKGRDYMMVMIDIDKFKQLNDEFGHIVGDIVLRNTAKCIKENTRDNDFVIRYGGDEFLIVLHDVAQEHVQTILERMERAQMCKSLLGFDITVSRGFGKRSECESPEALLVLADQRMYKNKGTHR